MKPSSKRSPFKRVVSLAVASSVLLQPLAPAYAVVSQYPSVFVSQPDTNMVYTLDDSGSMTADAMPDFARCIVGLPNSSSLTDTETNNCARNGGNGSTLPSMWKSGSGYLDVAYYQTTNRFARYLRSSAGNPLYYDRNVHYKPWPLPTNNLLTLAAANPAAVNIHVSDPSDNGRTINLTRRTNVSGGSGAPDNEANNYWRATYFVYDNPGVPLPQGDPTTTANPNYGTNNTLGRPIWTKVEIKPSVTSYVKSASRTDCAGASCTYAEELQNFANWLQYYRSRMLMTKGGVAAAFAKLGSDLRVGFGTLSNPASVGVRAFAGTDRANFFTTLYNVPSSGGTPLRAAMDGVGRYYQRTGINSPWAHTPGSQTLPEYDCRRSFHILSTDGFWNGAEAASPANGDNDNFTGLFTPFRPDGTTRYAYTDTPAASADPLVSRFAVSPFRDSSGTEGNDLSDVAAYYWREDLRPDMPNNVSSSARDPAFWQHVTTFTVGLGITGSGSARRASDNTVAIPPAEAASTSSSPFRQASGLSVPWLDNDGTREALVSTKTSMNWPSVTDDSRQTGDDLIRAAMVGRGRYLSATNPVALADGLGAALAEAINIPLSLANLAPSSGQVTAGSQIYQATYNPAQWYGRLYSFNQALDGTINTNPDTAIWEASHRLPAPASRNIYTWDGAASAPSTFTWSGLNTAQRAALNGDPRVLDFLRGSAVDEQRNGGAFRDRSRYTPSNSSVAGGALGDIVNGSPIKPSEAGAAFNALPAGTPGQLLYADYRSPSGTHLTNLLNTVFLGANDGMLHAFNRLNGVERFAFVPNAVYTVPRGITGATEQKLNMLSNPAYQHRFTVDGPPQVSDVFFGETDATGRWRTVLNGTTGAGARSIFLMDVTDPAPGTTGFQPGNILWEFSEANHPDMGYILSTGNVARMKNGKWALIFGNGYDSSRKQAKLFILDLATGAMIKEIAVGPVLNVGIGNGLSQPNFTMRDRVAEYIYAGDLMGNLWKFDVTSDDPANWRPSFGSAPEYAPLYTTPDHQPIAVMPTIGFKHPNGGVMLSFGTGKTFEVEDSDPRSTVNVNLRARQAIYGIWDKPGESTGFSGVASLQVQNEVALPGAANNTLTGTSSNTINWGTQRGWYFPLRTGGERVNIRPQIPDPVNPNSPLFVVANTPAEAVPCRGGGTARIFALNVYSGAAPINGVFDADRSGRITSADRGYNVLSVSTGVVTLPLFQTLGNGGTPTGQPTPEVDPARAWSDGRTGTQDGGREDRAAGPGPCGGVMNLGVSDTSTITLPFNQCGEGRGRISWRQIQ